MFNVKRILLVAVFAVTAIINTLAGDIYTVSSKTKLNIRSTASTTGKVLGTLEPNTEIEVLDMQNGFARFSFAGKDAYVSSKFLKKQGQNQAAVSTTETASKSQRVIAETTNAHATVYLFYDVLIHMKSLPISLNGENAFDMTSNVHKSNLKGYRWGKSKRKINVTNEGKLIIAYDYTWDERPYHDEISINVKDGGTYYVKIRSVNKIESIAKKRSMPFEQISEKEGTKLLNSNELEELEDYDYKL